MSAETFLKYGEPFPDSLVHEQLRKIFLCTAFSSSDILRNFLSYITEETLAGRSNTIKEYTIAVNVLNKPISFKPQHDAIVRIHAGRLRRALNYYYKEEGLADKIEISVPKGSYVPVFGSMPFRGKLPANPKQAKLPSLFNGVTLAIMPFTTFETEKSRMAFADNLGQQLSAEFGRFSDFSVISYYTTQQLPPKSREIPELASHFGARYVITGNVQFENRRLRVAVQLTDTHSDTQVWTELYHHPYSPSGLFEVADHVVGAVIAVLGDFNGVIMQQLSRGLPENKTGCLSVLSWHYDFYSRFNVDAFKSAYSAMEEAVVQYPSNEIAWAFLGELSLLAFLFNQNIRENPLSHGLRCARTALKINPLSQEAHITLGLANIFLDNRQAGMDGLEYALTLNPNASGTMGVIGCLMISAGEYDRGFGLIRKSMERNKSCPLFFHLFISLYYLKQKEYFLAFQQTEKMGMPDLVLNMILRILILNQLGKKTEAELLIKALRANPVNKKWITEDYMRHFINDQDLFEQLSKGLKSGKMPVLTVA